MQKKVMRINKKNNQKSKIEKEERTTINNNNNKGKKSKPDNQTHENKKNREKLNLKKILLNTGRKTHGRGHLLVISSNLPISKKSNFLRVSDHPDLHGRSWQFRCV